jgi:DNA-directed RNA polymerase specialized sigma24 family protein
LGKSTKAPANPLLSAVPPARHDAEALQTAIFPSATIAEFYRFALLLTGRSAVAERVMVETIAEAEAQLDEFRNDSNRQAWLAQRLRQRCLKNNDETSAPAPRLLRIEPEPGVRPEVLGIEAFILAEHFHGLPEPGRSALALFYLDLFTPEEISELLKMKLEELGATLAEARTRLQESLDGAKPPAA